MCAPEMRIFALYSQYTCFPLHNKAKIVRETVAKRHAAAPLSGSARG
jgi:hypothetical protein